MNVFQKFGIEVRRNSELFWL